MMRYILLSGATALALALSGCGKKAPETKPAEDISAPEPGEDITVKPEAMTPTAAAYPLKDMTLKNEFVNATATFPEDLGKIAPQLAEALEREADAEFGDLQTFAADDKAERPDYFREYEMDIAWSPIVRSGDIISMSKLTYIYSGGAHPNTSQAGLIYDLKTNTGVGPASLFVDPAAVEAILAKEVTFQIMSEKVERMGGNADDRKYAKAEVEENLSNESVLTSDIILLASTQPGKFGGMLVMFSPYEMGSYAEGSYQAVIPQSLFAAELKPEYTSLFAGEATGYED